MHTNSEFWTAYRSDLVANKRQESVSFFLFIRHMLSVFGFLPMYRYVQSLRKMSIPAHTRRTRIKVLIEQWTAITLLVGPPL